jgi:type IV secretion system protein VirB10
MNLISWLRQLFRRVPDAQQAGNSIAPEKREPVLVNDAGQDRATQGESLGEGQRMDEPSEFIEGERGIPSVNREQSIHSRVTNALTIAVMLALGVGFLTWYYSNALKRRADEDQRIKEAVASKAAGEMKLPPLGPVEPPRLQLDRQPQSTSKAVATHVLGPAPELSVRAKMVTVQATAQRPVAQVAFPLPPSVEESATLRLLNSPVLYRSTAVAATSLGDAPQAVIPMQSANGQLRGPMPVPTGVSASSANAGGDPSLGGLLQPTATPAVQAQMLPTERLLLPKGAFIDCTLETALDSQLPGMTTCITATDVFGADGRVVLLERGSKLVGETRGELHLGQNRVFVLWTEARTPQGVVVQLASPGTDELGRSGLPGYVDTHFWQRFGAAILISVIDGAFQYAIAAQSKASGGSAVVYNTQGARDVLTEVLRSTINIPPTVVKNQGERIQVFVARDLDFRPVYAITTRAAQ